ncbi:cytochrome P450 [Amycolatopsis sp. NPDC059021]|uniref:cytochrome P450 n=1 Tax=Amycolatopsis sp. NPDC059021 TaxID=3346704 RepID=UPI00366B73D2
MTQTVPHVQGLPTTRGRCPFDPPEALTELSARSPISRLVYPDGHEGWLVTGYAAARAVLADVRFSSRAELRRTPIPHAFAKEKPRPAQPGALTAFDPPEHTRLRKQLTGQFTVRRMQMLEPRVARITEEHLDRMAEAGPPCDLVTAFAMPIPSLVICELLGVPFEDRDGFQRNASVLFNLKSSAEEITSAMGEVMAYMGELVDRKRAEPDEHLLSGLIEAGELTDGELAMIAMTLLIAGYETTANMLALGTFALLSNPDQLAALRADPSLVTNAVEELMRYLSVIHVGPGRTAVEDVEVAGQLIRAGESVAVSVPAANRDPERFPDSDRLDITRPATGHIGFGHGVHQCLGQQLARVEMRIGYPALARRFPELRLAVPAEEVRMRADMAIYGVHELLVAW